MSRLLLDEEAFLWWWELNKKILLLLQRHRAAIRMSTNRSPMNQPQRLNYWECAIPTALFTVSWFHSSAPFMWHSDSRGLYNKFQLRSIRSHPSNNQTAVRQEHISNHIIILILIILHYPSCLRLIVFSWYIFQRRSIKGAIPIRQTVMRQEHIYTSHHQFVIITIAFSLHACCYKRLVEG